VEHRILQVGEFLLEFIAALLIAQFLGQTCWAWRPPSAEISFSGTVNNPKHQVSPILGVFGLLAEPRTSPILVIVALHFFDD